MASDISRGLRIIKRMKDLRITIAALAETCSVGTSTVGDWRAGGGIGIENLPPLALALNCSTDFILTGTTTPLTPQELRWLNLLHRVPQHARHDLLSYLEKTTPEKN